MDSATVAEIYNLTEEENQTTAHQHHLDYHDSLFYAKIPEVQIVALLLYGIVFLLSLSSNMLVILAIMLNSRLRTGTNMLVLSLAVADIVYCVSGMVFTPLGLMMDFWFAGEVMCKLIPMFACVGVHVISLTTMSIAVDRSVRTAAKHSSSLQTKPAILLNICIWALASGFSVPIGMHMEMNSENSRCGEHWEENEIVNRHVYSMGCLVVQFVIPTLVISICYIRMMKFFNKRYCDALSRSYSSESRRKLAELRRARSVSKLSMAIIVSFIILFTPLNAFNLVAEYNLEAVDDSQYAVLIFIASHLVTSTSTVANPILYGCFNTTFQRCLKRSRIFGKLFRPNASASVTAPNGLSVL